MDKFRELKAAALAATQGPWLIADENTPWNIEDATGQQVAISQQRTNTRQNPKQTDRTANAIFIAAANPAVALALLAELEASKTNAEYYKSAFEEQRDHADILEKRLATPVRLSEKYNMKMAGDKSTKSMFYGHNSAINDSADAIRAAGFTFTVGNE